MSDLYQNTNGEDVYAASEEGLQVTSHAQQRLYSSKGWVRFMSVLGFISFAGMVFGTIAATRMIGNIGGFGIFSVLLMLAMTIVIFMLSLRLAKFANAIGRMELTRDRYAFEAAMAEQMKFWRLMGILTMIWLVLASIGLISGLVA